MNPSQALWEKGDFTRIAQSMRESGEAVVESLGVKPGLEVMTPRIGRPQAAEGLLQALRRRRTRCPGPPRGSRRLTARCRGRLQALRRLPQHPGTIPAVAGRYDRRDVFWLRDESLEDAENLPRATCVPVRVGGPLPQRKGSASYLTFSEFQTERLLQLITLRNFLSCAWPASEVR